METGGDSFSANIFKWAPPSSSSSHPQQPQEQQPPPPPPPTSPVDRPRDLAEIFQGYGVRYITVARIAELGFTSSTLAGMREEELEDMMATMSHVFRWDLLVGERYGIKAAARAERRRIDEAILLHHHHQHQHHHQQHQLLLDQAHGRTRQLVLMSSSSPGRHNAIDALSQEGLSEEPVQQEREAAGSGGEVATIKGKRSSNKKNLSPNDVNKKKKKKNKKKKDDNESESDSESGGSDNSDGSGGVGERQREHPFIVTEPGEVARAKKNGLDYLFHLYEQCRDFLAQVQAIAKDRGDKCPTKVTNQVFRYAKKVGASYINKPKMRHYVHCYALHCLDEKVSNALRREFKERGENVGAWRQACYQPLVAISAHHGWDIDAVFSAHPRLSIWYVPTKLRQLCHLARSNTTAGPVNTFPRLPSIF